VAPWPKLFVNLRSSCETELARRYPLFEVTNCLGNSPKIAHKHYLQMTDASYAEAAAGGGEDKAVQKAVQHKLVQPSMTSQASISHTVVDGYNEICTEYQYARRDSNPQPRGPKPRALSS
jgi:hypothetical protein